MPPCASSSAPIRRDGPTLLDAEQLRLHRLGRHGRRVEHDERPIGAPRTLVDEPGGELLAGAGAAGDQHARIRRPELLDDPLQVGDRLRGADHPVDRATAGLEVVDLALQARGLERALGDQDQTVRLERLLDEVVGAELDRRHRGLDVAVAGDHHHGDVRVLLLDRFEQLQPVELRALQPDVEQDELRPARLDRRQRLVGIARGARLVALVLEDARRRVRGCRPRRRRSECLQPSA